MKDLKFISWKAHKSRDAYEKDGSKSSWLIICLICCLLIFISIITIGCVPITQNGQRIEITHNEDGLSAVKVNHYDSTKVLKAMVKGSIYSTGEQISLYGTCLDQNDVGFVNSYSTFAAWYPNGTQMFTGVAGQEMQTGYFVYAAPMSAVQGTYLTEFTCHINGTSIEAKAFGEWQNPMWVTRINDTLTQASAAALYGNQSIQMLNFTQEQIFNATQLLLQIQSTTNSVPGWFNNTWTLINASNVNMTVQMQNITAQLNYISQVANSSVDRNDSYLANLIRGIASQTGTPINGSLHWVEASDTVRYYYPWNIDVRVYNEYNQTVDDSKVICHISTTNDPAVVLGSMTYQTGVSPRFNDGILGYWTWQEKKIKKLDQFSWTVICAYK
jgi:hypothetical protein